MSSSSEHSGSLARIALSRCLWAVMLVCHIPALIASWRGLLQAEIVAEQLGGSLLLTASVIFFVLKLRGARFLEFNTDRRSLLAVTVAVGLLHADAIGTRLDFEPVPAQMPVAASTLFVAGLSRVQSVANNILSRGAMAVRRRTRLAVSTEVARFGAFAPRLWILAPALCTPRAPPA